MVEFVTSVYHFLVGTLHVGLLFIGVLIALTIWALLVARLRRNRTKQGSAHGLLQVHGDTQFHLRASIKCNKARAARGIPAAEGVEGQIPCGTKPVAVVNFTGDVMATSRTSLAKRIDEVLANKEKVAGLVVIVNSPGGGVAEYGQAYAEMERVRKAGIDLTVVTDTYAASGGYLMSLPANRIIAAPYSMVGSIGVVTEFLNFHHLAKRLGIEPLTLTAGAKKRSVTPLNDPTPEAVNELKEGLTKIHEQFRASVKKYRPQVDVEAVCTGEHWTAQEAFDKNLGLVDEIATSQELLFRIRQESDVIFVGEKVNPWEKGIFRFLAQLSTHCIDHVAARLTGQGQVR